MPADFQDLKAPPIDGKYRYNEWFVGKLVRLVKGHDFSGTPRAAADAALSHAKRAGFAAIALPALGPEGRLDNVAVWGDPLRKASLGMTDEVREELMAKGFKLRR